MKNSAVDYFANEVEPNIDYTKSLREKLATKLKKAKQIEDQNTIEAIVQYQIATSNIFSEYSINNLRNRVEEFYNKNLK
jgi:hypothetical protein